MRNKIILKPNQAIVITPWYRIIKKEPVVKPVEKKQEILKDKEWYA